VTAGLPAKPSLTWVRAVATAEVRTALLVALVAALLVLPRLGHRQIVGTHEAVYPMVARDMLERGAWLSAELRGTPYRFKPPLYPWTIAALSWPGGRVTETTARLPGAIAVVGAVVATFLLGARLFGRRAGLWAALILITSVLFFDHAVVSIPDVPMVFFGLLAALALWSVGNGGGRGARLGFWLALALGVFTKHFSGLLPLAVALVWLGLDGGPRALRRLAWWPGIAVFVLVTAAWLVPFTQGGAGRFATDIVWGDWLRQHIGGPRLGSFVRELAYAVVGFLPWTLALPVAVAAAIRARRERAVAFALWSLVVPALFVFAVEQQRIRYLLPLFPGAALLVAWYADREAAGAARRHAALGLTALAASIAGAIAVATALRAAGIVLPAPRWELGLLLAGVVALGIVTAVGLWTLRIAVTVPAVAAITAALLLGGGWVVDEWQNRAWDFRGVARDLGKSTRPLAVAALATDNQELLQVDFYLGRPLPALRSPGAVSAHLTDRHGVVVVEDSTWRSARQWLPLDPTRLRAAAVGAGVIVVTDVAP
jgi:4-amino-4-deoxy-L-arabinose transferase-like glycosyltransferase